jgi:hypothetical protein
MAMSSPDREHRDCRAAKLKAGRQPVFQNGDSVDVPLCLKLHQFWLRRPVVETASGCGPSRQACDDRSSKQSQAMITSPGERGDEGPATVLFR